MNFQRNSLIVLCLVGFLFLTFLLIKIIGSDNKIQSCYITYESASITNSGFCTPPIFKLNGFIPWRSDVLLGQYASQQEVLQRAMELKCQMNVK